MTLPLRKPKRKLDGEEEEAEKKTSENGEVKETAEAGEPKEGEAAPANKKPKLDDGEAPAKPEESTNADMGVDYKEETKEGESKEGETKAGAPPVKDTEAKASADPDAKPPAKDDDKAPVKTEEAVERQSSNPAESAVATAAAAAAVAAKDPAARATAPAPPVQPIYKEEEYEEPDDGAEIPEDPEHVWNARLVDLLLYKHQYRTLHVQATYDQHLHAWVDIQRKLYRRSKKDPKSVSALTQLRLTVLDSINFPFTLRGAAHWDRYFAKLQEFKKKHGHCLVPRLCEFPGLGDWVIDQRRQYKLMMQGKPSVLDPERQKKLEDLGFVWVVRNRPEWNNRFQELLQYKEKYGDTKVPQHYKEIPGLGKWVAKQREQFRLLQQGKHSFLTPDRLEKLNDAGFVWSVRKDGTDDLPALPAKKKTPVKKEEGSEKGAETDEKTGETKVKEEAPDKGKEDGEDSKEKADDKEVKPVVVEAENVMRV